MFRKYPLGLWQNLGMVVEKMEDKDYMHGAMIVVEVVVVAAKERWKQRWKWWWGKALLWSLKLLIGSSFTYYR